MEASSQNWVWHQSAKKEDSRPGVSGRNRIDRQKCNAVQEGRPGFRSHKPASRRLRRVRLSQGERDTSYQASEHVLRRGSSCPCRRTSRNQFSQKSEHPARTRGTDTRDTSVEKGQKSGALDRIISGPRSSHSQGAD